MKRLDTVVLFRRSEVDHFDRGVVVLVVEQKVLQLQVSMHDPMRMAVLNRREHLLHVFGCYVLANHFGLRNFLHQLSSWTVLRDQVVAFRIVVNLVEFHNVRMIQLFQNVGLHQQSLLILIG